MTNILLVKTSSMGDVIHNLPVVNDIRCHFPEATIDWVVEDSFIDIPALHPGVNSVIPVAIRRWRMSPWRKETRGGVRDFLARLREQYYDAVIDTQGLFKSAFVARAARGTRYGLDWASSREPLAFFYDRSFHVPRGLHAVERNRRLVSQALGYPLGLHVDYGVDAAPCAFPWIPARPYVVLLHATSADRKLWPEVSWMEVGNRLAAEGAISILPWGSTRERLRSERLAAAIDNAVVPPAISLAKVAGLLAGARAVIGVDTGLTHLAAALGVPTIGIYFATDSAATGLHGCARAVNLGSGRIPTAEEVCSGLERLWA